MLPSGCSARARDVTEQHRARAELAFLAEHDPLTGIANRRRITGRLQESLADARGAALLLVDVDNFKDINDIRGHAAGDRVMRTLARTPGAQLQPDSLLGRLGGDEFAVVAPACGADEALALGERLCAAARHTQVPGEGDALRVTVSIGWRRSARATTWRARCRRPTSRCTTRRGPAATAPGSTPATSTTRRCAASRCSNGSGPGSTTARGRSTRSPSSICRAVPSPATSC